MTLAHLGLERRKLAEKIHSALLAPIFDHRAQPFLVGCFDGEFSLPFWIKKTFVGRRNVLTLYFRRVVTDDEQIDPIAHPLVVRWNRVRMQSRGMRAEIFLA